MNTPTNTALTPAQITAGMKARDTLLAAKDCAYAKLYSARRRSGIDNPDVDVVDLGIVRRAEAEYSETRTRLCAVYETECARIMAM